MVTKKTETEILDTVVVPEASNFHTSLVVVLLCITLILQVINLYFLTGNSFKFSDTISVDALGIKRALLEVEYDKVGGKKNYDLINKASLMQLQEQMPQIEQFVNGSATSPNGTTPTATNPTGGTLSSEDIEMIKKDAVIEGNQAGDILVLEYSDMECPFCMKQYHDTKLWEGLQAQYGEKIGFAFKNNRGVNHKGTEVKALGALCAQKLGGNEAYIKFYKGVMDGSTNEGGVYDETKLGAIATTSGVDVTAWQACVDKKETLALFSSQTLEAQKYGLGGTPGTLILNTKTGKYDTVEGAYPYETFTQKIDALLK